MKKLFPLLLVVLLTNCGQEKEPVMKGAYSMVSQKINDGSKDTVINRRQLKIFTGDHVFYAAMRLPDSLASFGIGTYEFQHGNIIEHYFYTSANAFREDAFTLNIEKSDTGYRQVIPDLPYQGKTATLTEEYRSVGKGDSTALDGAWKMVHHYLISAKGDTTTNEVILQFKVYQSGNFIWASNYEGPNKKVVTFFGYGTFQVEGNNRCREVTTLSTYPPLINTPVTIDLEFIGGDSYKQTILQPSGSRSVETYERVKRREL